jgi:DNA-binding transcriptional LysR family regulator
MTTLQPKQRGSARAAPAMSSSSRHVIGAPPRIGFHCDDWIGKQALVGAGLGITLYPRLALGAPRHDIAVRPLPRSLPSRDIYAAFLADHQAPAVHAMLACLRESAQRAHTQDP